MDMIFLFESNYQKTLLVKTQYISLCMAVDGMAVLNNCSTSKIVYDANYLADQLGVIYVGLAYRCKGNNATFADAIQDLEASVQWFFDNADTYNADLTRIGFGGSSAGSTLAAVMAQKYKNCKLFVGAEGMYNLVEHSEERSTFPSQKARELYGLATEKESKKASAFYNLRENPPSHFIVTWRCGCALPLHTKYKICRRNQV